MLRERQLCTFELGPHLCGLPVDRVQEILRPQRMTRMPLAQPSVRGLINLRGQIVVALDLRERFGLSGSDEPTRCKNVVVRGVEGLASLLVDEVGDVVTVSDEQHEMPPDMLSPSMSGLVSDVFKLDDRLVLLLDPDVAVSV